MKNRKIFAIPVLGNSSSYILSKQFARSPYFIIYNLVTDEKMVLENNFYKEEVDSGTSLANKLIDIGVTIFCGVDIGFNVLKIAKENNIQLVLLANKNAKGESIISLIKDRNH